MNTDKTTNTTNTNKDYTTMELLYDNSPSLVNISRLASLLDYVKNSKNNHFICLDPSKFVELVNNKSKATFMFVNDIDNVDTDSLPAVDVVFITGCGFMNLDSFGFEVYNLIKEDWDYLGYYGGFNDIDMATDCSLDFCPLNTPMTFEEYYNRFKSFYNEMMSEINKLYV